MEKSKKKCVREKDYIWNHARWGYENGRYAEAIIGDSATMCNEIKEPTKSTLPKTVPAKGIPINLSEKNLICKINSFFILRVFF